MKKSTALLFIAYTFAAHAAQEIKEVAAKEQVEQTPPFATHGLLIFLDTGTEDNDRIETISNELLMALDQQAGPIITSPLLLRDIVKQPTPEAVAAQKRKEKDIYAVTYEKELALYQQFLKDCALAFDTGKTEQAVSKKLHKLTAAYRENLATAWLALQLSFVKEAASLRLEDWTIKEINPHLLLLIPKVHLEKIKKIAGKPGKLLSQNELALGVKFEHMKEMNNISSFLDTYATQPAPDAGGFLVNSLRDIFITTQEYRQETQSGTSEIQPQWVIYLTGHGTAGVTIASIEINEFKKLLMFLDTQIHTRFFVYSSCYAAGVNTELVYRDHNSPFFKTFSYPLATGALTDAPSLSKSSSIPFADIKANDVDMKHKRIKPRHPLDFAAFLSLAQSGDVIDFPKLLGTILPGARESVKKEDLFSLPQLKLPGIPWFNVIDTHNKIVSIGRVLAATRTEPLNIITFFNRKVAPLGILLYATVIPFEMQIPGTTMPLLISMTPGDSIHKIKKITTQATFKDFASSFNPLKDVKGQKLFWIEELETMGVITPATKLTFNDVFIELNDGKLQCDLTRSGISQEWDFYKAMFSPRSKSHVQKYTKKIEATPAFRDALAAADREIKTMELIRKAQEFKVKKMREAEEKS